MAMRVLEEAAGGAASATASGHAPGASEQQQQPQQPASAAATAVEAAAAAGAAAHAGATPPAPQPPAAANAASAAENGKSPGKKRKRPGETKAEAGGAGAAMPAAAGVGLTPHVDACSPPLSQLHTPSKVVDLTPILEIARGAESQEALRTLITDKYPPTRGRAATNAAFRDLFLTLCPGHYFHGRSSALPHMTHRLFELVGKPVGKPPAPYKPRGPRSPPTGAAPAVSGGAPGSVPPPAPAAAPTQHAAPAPPPPQAAAAAAGTPAQPPAAAAAGGDGGEVATGPAAAAAARAAAIASGEIPAGTAGGLDPKVAMAKVSAEYPAELIRIAALVRRSLGMQRGSVSHLRMMLKTLHLANQEVRFQTKSGKVLNHGKISEAGGILCFCKHCNGKEVSASEFEEHSGSKDRRPADGIFLESCNRSLKELLTLINSPEMASCTGMVDIHMETCYQCNLGGELLCCDGCNCAFHMACVNLESLPQGDWFCPVCTKAGITQKPEPMLPLQPKQVGSLKPPKASGKTRPGSSSKLSKKAAGLEAGGGEGGSQGSAPPPPSKRPPPSGGGGTGRVHMAAPMAPRAPRLGRPGAGRSNKNKRLFEGEEGALANGQKLFYRTTQGETLLEGVAVVEHGGPSGILCGCCNTLISASGFEAHAGRGQRRAPYDNIFTEDGLTLKAMAALLPDLEDEAVAARPSGEYGLEEVADDAREVISELDTLAGGCVLCHEVDFQRGGFGPRTIMLCDQCEREFHVGCLKKCGKCELDAVPEGDWYCSEECERIRSLVSESVQAQMINIPGYPSHTWQVMRGKDGKTATAHSLRAAQEILQESFDPIMDLGSNTDLLPVMLYARRAGEWDYSNCLTLLLRHKGKPVVAAICRIFGPQMAELPLIATKNTARRQGHARILVDCFQSMLKQAGVHTLVLPAAHETVETWKHGFSFLDMPEDIVRLAKQQLRILIFPGTEVLWKHFKEVKPPEGHHVLRPSPDRPTAEEAAEALEVAAITANMVACVAAACGEPVLPETLGMTTAEAAAAVPQQAAGAAMQGQQPPHAAAGAGMPAAGGPQQQQQYAQQHYPQQQQDEPADAYEAMIAAAISAADGQIAAAQQLAGAATAGAAPAWAGGAPAWGAAGMEVDGMGQHPHAQHAQQLHASDSDVSISDADDEGDGDDSSEPLAKRPRQDD